jgi:hypothetical protein
MREKAAKTAVDGFVVVERIYRHAYQTLVTLKDKLKMDYNLKVESPLYYNPQSVADPKSWIHHFRGLYLARCWGADYVPKSVSFLPRPSL